MAAPPVANAGPPAPPAKVLLRLAGSDVLAGRLVRRLAAGYLLLTGDSDITGRLAEGSDDFEVAGQQTEQSEVIRITSSNSAAGFTALLRGSADIALSTRKPSADEANRLTTVGDMNTPTNEHVIAIQGIAAIVGNPSRVATLTVAQLKDILTARVRDWSEVGGTKGPISVYVMDGDEGADRPQDLLVDAADLDPTVRRLASEDAVALAVAADRSAVGFVTLGAVGRTHPVPIADNGSIPFAPTDVTILTQDYPLIRRLYFYNGDDLSGGTVRRFVDYVASPAGQASVEAEGMMVLGVKSEAAVVPSPASERFRLFVAGSNRLSVDFRFQPNSLQLTARSARDLDLLACYVKSQRIDPSRLMLAGFADDTGRPAASMAASQRQAQAAAAALAKVGLVPGKVSSFGAELPVADNTTAEGKEHNRRVEVYLSPR